MSLNFILFQYETKFTKLLWKLVKEDDRGTDAAKYTYWKQYISGY